MRHFSDKYQRDMEDKFKTQHEAGELIRLIAAEFSSDPMSVQCFDLRIVERVKYCAAKLKLYENLF